MKLSNIQTNKLKPIKAQPSFKGVAINLSSEIQSNSQLNRGLIDMFGVCVPWAIMANNKDERREKLVRFSIGFVIPFITPFITLPLSNKFAMKHMAKLTTKFSSKEHKAIWISNKHLKNAEDLKEGLEILGKKLKFDPKQLLEKCGGDYEKLRNKLVESKNAVLLSDLLFTTITWANAQWITSQVTKMMTGKKGFTAEYSMADKELVEARAQKHEKTKKAKWLATMGACVATSFVTAGLCFKALKSKNPKGILKFVKDNADKLDYKKGIYMSRLTLLISVLCASNIGTLLAARNKAELKDLAVRIGTLDGLYFTGDLALASILSRLCNPIFKTDLMEKDTQKNLWNKIFPPQKKLDQLDELIENAKDGISKKHHIKNKKVATGIYWTSMLGLMATLGFAVPAVTNWMTKKDVEKDLKNQTKPEQKAQNISPRAKEIFKAFLK